MNPIVHDLIARQRVREAVREAEMQHRWASVFGVEQHPEPARRPAAQKGWMRWIMWKPQRAAS